ncbi:antitoxin VapB family protein [Candidatus Pacearchaeota archaeon]|nr:antitoxin VapB family protein [Candidatus Pacearchaeota archaeon]
MATKTISIMDDVYKLLLINKGKNESFSDVIRRILIRKKDIMEFAGMWKNVSDKDIKEMKKIIGELRDSSTNQLLENDMS